MNHDSSERRLSSLMEIGMAVSRVEEKMDGLNKNLDNHIQSDEKRFTIVGDDLKSINRNMWMAVGGVSVLMWVINSVIK